MPYPRNIVTAAIQARRSCHLAPLQVANGVRADKMPGPQVDSEVPASEAKAAWLPTIPGQAAPMIGEVVSDDESSLDL